LSLLPAQEKARVERFRFEKDKKLALGSRLMQRMLVHTLFKIPFDRVDIMRTKAGKPVAKLPPGVTGPGIPGLACFNLNVSHHGEFVAIASEPTALVGLDIMDTAERPRQKQDSKTFLSHFEDKLTPGEWRTIHRDGSEKSRFAEFYKHWALKEAYIKAVGIGLGFELTRADFSYKSGSARDAIVRIDGQVQPDWSFHFENLDESHVACVARGPPSAGKDWHDCALPCTHVPADVLRAGLDLAQVPFRQVQIKDLIPANKLSEYNAVCGI